MHLDIKPANILYCYEPTSVNTVEISDINSNTKNNKQRYIPACVTDWSHVKFYLGDMGNIHKVDSHTSTALIGTYEYMDYHALRA